jgi:hypothetical protein
VAPDARAIDRARHRLSRATRTPPSPGSSTASWIAPENYESMELALARSEDVRGVLLRDGWQTPTKDA